MCHCGYFVTTLILVTSGLLSIGSSVENKICFSVSNQHICYFQPKEDITWIQWDVARNICQNNSATLPIIENQEVQKTFEEYLRNISLNTREIWLGGRQVIKKEWLWSNNKPFYQPDLIYAGDQNQRTQTVIKRANNSESPSNATLRYASVLPSWTCYHICQYTASRCPADNSTIQNEHHGCLKVFNNRQLNANEATKDCSKSGGNLATFDGDEFLTKAPKVYQQMRLSSHYLISYYIGLHRIDTKSWLWMRSNNENSSSTMEGNYDNWSDRNNRANGDCLFAKANDHRWDASGCDYNYRKRFICQTIETLAATMTTKEDVDKMNDQLLVSLIGAIIGIAALIAAAFIIIVLLRRHRRTISATRSITENEEHYQDINRISAYEQEADNYAELTEADNYAELTETDN